MNSEVFGSYVAYVYISIALLPNPSSVRAKHPIVDKSSMPFTIFLCLSEPNVITVPPNRLYCTVSFVANDASTRPAISWFAKTFNGFSKKSYAENTR